MYPRVPEYKYVYYMHAYGKQKRVSGALELELQAILSPMIWVLGTKPGYSAKAGSDLNHRAISFSPDLIIFISVCVHIFVCVCIYEHRSGELSEARRRCHIPLELELQAAVTSSEKSSKCF